MDAIRDGRRVMDGWCDGVMGGVKIFSLFPNHQLLQGLKWNVNESL
jgi:hypothetical protein